MEHHHHLGRIAHVLTRLSTVDGALEGVRIIDG
jgi:hypothetical protein